MRNLDKYRTKADIERYCDGRVSLRTRLLLWLYGDDKEGR